jgi:hypothetical protein
MFLPKRGTHIKDFNSATIEFIDFVAKICPVDDIRKDLCAYKNLARIAINANSRKLIDNYVVHVLKYKDNIENYDEEFFINKKFDDNEGGNEVSMMESMKFKDIWQLLDDKQKKNIFNRVIKMTSYAELYFTEDILPKLGK